jgi:hypothetical protein
LASSSLPAPRVAKVLVFGDKRVSGSLLVRFCPWRDNHWLESLEGVPLHLGRLGALAGGGQLRAFASRRESEADALFNLKRTVFLFPSGSSTPHHLPPIILMPISLASYPQSAILTAPNTGAELAASSIPYQPYIASNFFDMSDVQIVFHKNFYTCSTKTVVVRRTEPTVMYTS